jgi:predicted metal-dependent hydrolase
MTLQSCQLQTSDGLTVVPFRLRRSSRNRYLRVSVRDTGEVLLSVPPTVSDSGALDFLRGQAEWLLQTLGKVQSHRPQNNIVEHLRHEPWLSLDGRRAHVMLDETRIRTHWVADPERGETIIRYFTGVDSGSAEVMEALFEMARRFVPVRTRELAARVGVRIGGVRIRNQRTLWGSCTQYGNLSFNWRIILLPPHLHDHIILHELAHTTHLDHSPEFYNLLQKYDPNSRQNDHSISKLSPVFMALGRK